MLAVITALCAHLLSIAVPLALLQTYDRILPNEAYSTTFVLAVGVTVAIILEALLRYGRAVLFAHVGAVFERRMTVRLIDHLMRADGKAAHELGAPAMLDAVRAVSQVRDFWSGSAAAALHELPFLAIYIVLVAYIGGWLALIPLALTLIAFIAALLISRASAGAVRAVERAEAYRNGLVWGIFGGLVEAKAMAAETVLTRRYRDAVAINMEASARVENYMVLIRENGALLAQISTIAVVTFGAFMVIAGQLTTGGLAACSLLAGRSISPLMGAFAYLSRLAHRKEMENRIAAVFSLPLAPRWAGTGDRPFQGGTIEISGSAIAGGPVSIPQGSMVAIRASDPLAATGMLEAVARLDDSLGLKIAFDGQSADFYDGRSLQNRITIASARTEMIRGSLLDNLTLFAPQYEADAIRLSDRLGLDAFVDGLRGGLMTEVGPTGAEIVSPGIAARIGIIRALVRRPAVLCLDEVGGMLDLDGMRRLTEILGELKGHVTILFVSSDPTLLPLADMEIGVEGRASS